MNVKQVLCVRRDLNMRKGKIAAQCAHASLKVFLDKATIDYENRTGLGADLNLRLTPEMLFWMDGVYAKICVSVDSEAELLEVYQKALDADIPCSLITDAGLTEFNNVPTKTVVAIGPAKTEEINKITGGLKLL